jgi:hypothetical protein
MNAPATPQKRRAARALQALFGIVITAIGVGAFDWRAGVTALGLLILMTSAAWRNAK